MVKRRVWLGVLWLSIVAIGLALWLWQDKRGEANDAAAVGRFTGAVTGTSSHPEDPDYTVPFIIGIGGVVGVVVAGTQLKRAKEPPSP